MSSLGPGFVIDGKSTVARLHRDVPTAEEPLPLVEPAVALRLWNVGEAFAHIEVAQGASDDLRLFAEGLRAPYCGANAGFEAASLLEQDDIASIAMVTLRVPALPDADRYYVIELPDAHTNNFANLGPRNVPLAASFSVSLRPTMPAAPRMRICIKSSA